MEKIKKEQPPLKLTIFYTFQDQQPTQTDAI